MPSHIKSHSFFLCALDFKCILLFSFRFHMTAHLWFISPFISLSERILLPIFCLRKVKLKDGCTSSALKTCEVFQTENKTQSKTPLYFLFLICIICIYSLNYIQQTQKNRLLTLGETNAIFYWYFKLCFTEIMIPESLFTVFQFQPQRFIFRQWHYSFYYLAINNYFVIRFTFTMWIVHKRMFIFMQRRNWIIS